MAKFVGIIICLLVLLLPLKSRGQQHFLTLSYGAAINENKERFAFVGYERKAERGFFMAMHTGVFYRTEGAAMVNPFIYAATGTERKFGKHGRGVVGIGAGLGFDDELNILGILRGGLDTGGIITLAELSPVLPVRSLAGFYVISLKTLIRI